MPRLIYSFVVDAAAKFQDQAEIFLKSLLATGVAPSQIHAHVTPNAKSQEGLPDRLASYGINLHELTPFLDGTYCNKLA